MKIQWPIGPVSEKLCLTEVGRSFRGVSRPNVVTL